MNPNVPKILGKQAVAVLAELRDRGGEIHYERLGYAAACLADRDWVADPSGGGGDAWKAIERLERDYFADVCAFGAVTLPELLDVYHDVPDVARWRECKFNLRKLSEMVKAVRTAERQATGAGLPPKPTPAGTIHTPPRPLTEPLQFRQLAPAKAAAEYEKAFRAADEGERLREEVLRLRKTVDKLRGQLAKEREDKRRIVGELREIRKRLRAVGSRV